MSLSQIRLNEESLRLLLEKGFTCLPSLGIADDEYLFLRRVGIFAAKHDDGSLIVCRQGWRGISLFRGKGDNADNYTNIGTLQEL